MLPLAGSLLLLACMIFAFAKVESAEKWIGIWIPFVVAGVVLVFLGTITRKKKDGGLM